LSLGKNVVCPSPHFVKGNGECIVAGRVYGWWCIGKIVGIYRIFLPSLSHPTEVLANSTVSLVPLWQGFSS